MPNKPVLIPYDKKKGAKNKKFKAAVLKVIGAMFTHGSMIRSDQAAPASKHLLKFTVPANECLVMMYYHRLYVFLICFFVVVCSGLLYNGLKLAENAAGYAVLGVFVLLTGIAVHILHDQIKKLGFGPVAKQIARDWKKKIRSKPVRVVCTDFLNQLSIIPLNLPEVNQGYISEEWDDLASCNYRVGGPLHRLFGLVIDKNLHNYAKEVMKAERDQLWAKQAEARKNFALTHAFGKLMLCEVGPWENYFTDFRQLNT